MILYDFPLSPFAQKVKIALREKGLPFERRNAMDPAHAEDFARGNPRREFPMLVDGAARIPDSTVILDYLDERFPGQPMLPGDPDVRAALRGLEELADTRLEAVIYCIAEVSAFPAGEDAAAAAVIAASRSELARLHDVLAGRLGDEAFFGGDTPGRADFSLLPSLNAGRVLRLGPEDGPLAGWLARMNARPAVAETVAEIKPCLADFRAEMDRIRRGEARRQIRDHRLDWLIQAGGLPIIAKRLAAGEIRFSSM